MNKTLLKNIGIWAALVAIMLVLSYAFVPQVLEGKIVNQSDISGWQGMAKESLDWNAAHPDDKTRWSGSMFSGMPNVTFVDDFEGDWTKVLYKALLWGRRPASYLFIAMLGAFLMMLSMGVNRFLALAGAVAVAFCSYNLQIIQVGHNTKMQAIAFAPWALAAMIFVYRSALGERKCRNWLSTTLLGAAMFALALSFQVKANHVQITYYLAIIILIYALATFVSVLMNKDRKRLFWRFAAASAALLVMGSVGIATNANKLIPTYEYAPFTMRGGSELSGEGINSKGLDLDYATAWSYGFEELPNLMIPNYNGGASGGSLDSKSATWKLFKQAGENPKQICSSLPLYWGPQPFTAGPMYMGAISIFLFILGLFLLKGREKWWALACVILAVLLALGRHLMWFTQLCFDYAPMYNKFRTVSMALVILQFCLPLLGIYTLDRVIKRREEPGRVVKATLASLGITAGFCLLVSFFPSIAGNFEASSDSMMHPLIADALQADREHLLRTDALRSFFLILVSAAAIVWALLMPSKEKMARRLYVAGALVGLLILADMWSVGKRYLNKSHFVRQKDFNAHFEARPVDQYILEDNDPAFRVLDLSESTFNSSLTSYRHKSIGGYSPTKMQRYQDLIDHYLSKEIEQFRTATKEASTIGELEENMPRMSVVSMLNGKYVIVGADYAPVENKYAMGPAWFVGKAVAAESADEEIKLLGMVDLSNCAVVRKNHLASGTVGLGDAGDSEETGGEIGTKGIPYGGLLDMYQDKPAFVAPGTVEMISYAPNELHYSYESNKDAMLVFSEIYHPYWKATLNGEPLPLFRANWILRAALVPAGKGDIIMRYVPEDCILGERISRACSIVLLLLVLGCAGYAFRDSLRGRKEVKA